MPIKKGMTRQDAVKGQKMLDEGKSPEYVCKVLKVNPKNFAIWMKNKKDSFEEQKKRNAAAQKDHKDIMAGKKAAGEISPAIGAPKTPAEMKVILEAASKE